jgi:hypothetical protein
MARKTRGKTVRMMSDTEIAAKCRHLTGYDIMSLQMKVNWDGVPILHALDYMKACGIDLDNAKEMDKHTKYLKRKPSWSHVKKHKEYNARWLPMMLLQADYERGKC